MNFSLFLPSRRRKRRQRCWQQWNFFTFLTSVLRLRSVLNLKDICMWYSRSYISQLMLSILIICPIIANYRLLDETQSLKKQIKRLWSKGTSLANLVSIAIILAEI